MAIFEQDYLAAGQRWQAAAAGIARTEDSGPASDTLQRKEAFIRHQLATAGGARLWAGAPPPAPLHGQFGRERIIGKNDLLSFDALLKAIAIGRFVGMVCQHAPRPGLGAEGELVPVATGSMVSPRLLLTNNHVLGSREEAARSVVKFDYQLGENGVALAVSTFELCPDAFFATDTALDYTLVAVASTAKEGAPLAHFGWNRLIGTEGKILKGYPVNIIQHPEGNYKQIVLGGNEVLELSQDDFLYDADTLPGSSGAPVFNREWEIVALHRRSVPHLIEGKIVTKGGQVWTRNIPESEIWWIGNLGTRVSSLVRHIKALPLDGEQSKLRRELIDNEPPNPFLVSQQALGARSGAQAESTDAGVVAGNVGNVGNVSKSSIANQTAHASTTIQVSVALELRIDIASVTLSLPPRQA